ncbi:MAG: hypothetical protein RIC56_14735 [Pseudomonadales bacterium]
MWSTIDSFARPPLGRHLHGRALALNQRARGLLERAAPTPGDGRALGETLMASVACWQLFRQGLPAPRQGLLQRHLQRQGAIADALASSGARRNALPGLRRQARSRGQQRCLGRLQERLAASAVAVPGRRRRRALARLLETEARWLDELGQAPPPSESELHAGLARLYRRARQASAARPGSAVARRRLTRLVRGEELIFSGPGLISEAAGVPERRRLLDLVDEDAWLAGLVDSPAAAAGKPRDRQRLGKLVRRRRRELAVDLRVAALLGFGESVVSYRRALPWRTFIGLAGTAGVIGNGPQTADFNG